MLTQISNQIFNNSVIKKTSPALYECNVTFVKYYNTYNAYNNIYIFILFSHQADTFKSNDISWLQQMKRNCKNAANPLGVCHTLPAIECVSPEVRESEMPDTSGRSIFSLCVTVFCPRKPHLVKWSVAWRNLSFCQRGSWMMRTYCKCSHLNKQCTHLDYGEIQPSQLLTLKKITIILL